MSLNGNMEELRKLHGDQAGERFRELCDLGGFGNVDPNYSGGLGLLGALHEDNTAVSEKSKDRIAEIMHIDRKKDVDNHKGVGLPRTNSPKSKE